MPRFFIPITLLCLSGPAFAQTATAANTPPPAGWALSYGLSTGWTSNPLERTQQSKGDLLFRPEIGLSYRQPLWQGAALVAAISGNTEQYWRESRAGGNRVQASLALSQSWQGFNATLNLVQRKALNHDLSAHDSASREIGLGISRNFTLREGLSLTLFARGARRFVDTLYEDQWRLIANTTLAYKVNALTYRATAGVGYALEDKTVFLPRVRDQSFNVSAGVSWEWKKDHELSGGISYSRTFSSLAENRTKIISIAPKVSAVSRF